MLAFDKSNANLLKELLYRSYVHDAKLESIRYDSEDKCIKIASVDKGIQNKTTKYGLPTY